MHTIPYPVYCGFVLLAYFLPTITAFVREHRRLGWICLANILVGWTIVGWALVAMWAMSSRRHRHHNKRKPRGNRPPAETRPPSKKGRELPQRTPGVVSAGTALRRGLVLPTGRTMADPFSPSLDEECAPPWRHFSPQTVTEAD